jgi:DNA-binding transcriptional LysR family regulator
VLQLHRLEGFYRVAKAAGYARAAREFPYPITQPGVHAQVRKLEEELGARLFERVAKDRMVPTRAGRRLLEFCTPFFEQLPEVVDAIGRGSVGGRIRIEAGALEIQEVLPAWVRRVLARTPEIELELREIDSADHERLLRDQVDVIVDYQPTLPSGVETRLVAVHHSFLVASSNHPTARRGRMRVEDFLREPFVALGTAFPQHSLQLEALRALGAEPRRVTHAPSVASILAFVAAGLGYSLIPWPSPRGPRLRGVTAVALRGPGTRFPVLASWRARHEPDPVLDAVLRLAPSIRTRSTHG